MRTTFDLPDDLMRRAKAYAAMKGLKLRDLVAEGLEVRLSERSKLAPKRLPKFEKSNRGTSIPSRTQAEIEEELNDG
jgi:hypothetical protein